MAVRLFEGSAHAASYAAFRPTYPASVLEAISTFITAHSGSSLDTAVDVACGSGQGTFFLTRLFSKVTGVDVSKAQVENAQAKLQEKQVPEGKSVEFLVGSSDSLPLETSSVDLVSCAQAWHWFEPSSFYREAVRVLKPRGTLAIYGYGNVVVASPECNRLVSYFYTSLRQGGYWHKKRDHIDNHYESVTLPAPFTVSERKDLHMHCKMTLSHLIGYISTWSGYCKFTEKNPGNTALQELKEELGKNLELQEGDPCLDISFPLFLILGQKAHAL